MASRHARRRTSHLGVLPLTSMIDVVFLLLVYFLVTSNFAQLERDLSSSVQSEGGGVRTSELQPQVIEIGYVDGVVVYQIGGRGADSKEGLIQILSVLPKEPGVAIRASRDVPISAIASAMQASQDAGFTRRSYVPAEE
jgi:biopolymer transport protein ExbD